MPKRSRLSERERGIVDGLNQEGVSKSAIARRIQRSEKVVRNFLKNPKNYGKKNPGGRPQKLSARDKRSIVNLASNSTIGVRQIQRQNCPNVSKNTVWRVLQKSPVFERAKMMTAPPLKPDHINARLNYARKYMNVDWTKVIFSDEKKWNLDGPDGFCGYWHDLRKEKRIFSKRNFGGGSTMVWGAFCSSGKLRLAFVSSRMNSQDYIKVMEAHLIPFLRGRRRGMFSYQQDNAAIHVSRQSKAWFESKKIKLHDHPVGSPDLNPMENLWGYLVRKVYENGKQYGSVGELETAIVDACESIPQSLINNLIGSMNNRCFEVISNQGKRTKY